MKNLLRVIGALIPFIIGYRACAITATTEELRKNHAWVTKTFAAGNSVPPFSFTYDGRLSREFLKSWDMQRSENKQDGKSVRRTLIYTDPKTNLVASRTWQPEELAKRWSSGFLTYHYALVCKWPKPPAHDEITVRIEFVDYLTGRPFTAQTVCKIDLPAPTTQP